MRIGVLASLMAAMAVGYAGESAGQIWIGDIDRYHFESQTHEFLLIGTPVDDVVNSTVDITDEPDGVRSGRYALKLDYHLDPDASPALVDVKTLQKDLISISFWIKAVGGANWVVYLLDADGAGFLAFIDVPPDEWLFVDLKPEDFEPDQGADVVKEAIELDRLDIGMAMLDARNKYDTPGLLNTVYIDDFMIAREPLQVHEGDYVVDGVVDTIDTSMVIRGDLIVQNGGQLEVTASRLHMEGNIRIDASVANFRDGIWRFNAERPEQYAIDALQGSQLTFTGGKFLLLEHLHGLIDDGSQLRFEGVHNRTNATQGITYTIWNNSTLELLDADFIGEFLLGHGTSTTVVDSELVTIWAYCQTDLGPPIVLPPDDLVESWSAPPEWGRVLSLTNAETVNWTFVASGGCNMTLQDSNPRAVGLSYRHEFPQVSTVTGLEPNLVYADFCVENNTSVPQTEFTVCLKNSSVQSWNLYASGAVVLVADDVTVGEAIAYDDAQLNIINALIDGSGGHFGAQERATVHFRAGEITAEIRAFGTTGMTIIDSNVIGDINAADNSIVTLQNTTHTGNVRLTEQGQVIVE